MEQVKQFLGLTQLKKQLEEQLKIISQEIEALQEPLLNYFEANGMGSVKIDGHTVYLHRQLWASVDTGDPKALNAMEEAGLGFLIKPSVNSNSLSSYVRELDVAGETMPITLKSYIKVAEKFQVRSRKA